MTKGLAVEWAPYNVQVNCIIPGCFHTELTKAIRSNNERYNWFLSRIPAGRWGEPDDLKGAIVFLSSDASNYVTGISLPIDGGYLAN